MSDIDDVDAVNSGMAWADKYGDLHYVKKGDKIVVSFDESDAPVSPDPEPCTLCADGKIYPSNGKAYPCECVLGDKWAKNTGYMGPATEIKKGPVSLKGYYEKEFLDTLKTPLTESMTYKDYTNVYYVPTQPGIATGTFIYKGPVDLMEQPELPVSEPEQEPPNIRVVEEVKGRKFKKL